MRLTLFKKILIAMLFISTLMVVGMALLINFSFQSGLQSYLNDGDREKLQSIAEDVESYYSAQYEWGQLSLDDWRRVLISNLARPEVKNKVKFGKNFNDRVLKKVGLLDIQRRSLFKGYKARELDKSLEVAIIFQGQTVGWVSMKKRSAISGELERSFYRHQQQHFLWIVLWVALLSFVLAWILVRHILTPLKRLELAAGALQEGDYNSQIEVKGDDELSSLSRRFNELSGSLLRQKETRDQWLADISHELRTPISVLKSEIEALQDGIRKPEPKYINSLHKQVQNLSELVNYLHQLSMSDAGLQFDLSKQVDIKALLEESCTQYQARCEQKQITMSVDIPKLPAVPLYADKKALTQLFTNIFENTYRYTDSPGQLHVSLAVQQPSNMLSICFEDSKPGVPDHALTKLFERLYRVDPSRSRLSGGSGLGLSICQTIVKAHGGEIYAQHSSLGGLSIYIQLPLLKESR